MILESDAAAIVNRVGMKSAESGAPGERTLTLTLTLTLTYPQP